MQNEANRSINYQISFICAATIILTILTQIPTYGSIFRPFMYAIWVVTFVVALFINKAKIRHNRFIVYYLMLVVIIGLECLFCNSVFGTHINSYALQVIPLPFLCYLVGHLLVCHLSSRESKIQILIYYVTSLLLFTYIFVEYVGSFSVWLNANYYIYEQKNSAAQIIGCAIILGYFMIHSNSKLINFIRYFTLVFLFLLIVAMQCRTALVGVILSAAVYYFNVLSGKRKFIVTILLIVVAVIVLNNSTLSQYVLKAFVFNKRQTQNLDYFTSGRLTLFQDAWNAFKESPLIGTGHYRVDDLYLCMLADIGIIGAVPIFCLWINRIIRNIKAFNEERTQFTSCVLCLTVFYIAESTFEAYPPFGPGVCAFMFWILCAFVDARGVVTWKKEKAL